MEPIICQHCKSEFIPNRLARNQSPYCHKVECQRTKAKDYYQKRKAKGTIVSLKCSKCGRWFNKKPDSPFTTCARCRGGKTQKKNNKVKLCTCCGVRPIYPGFRFLCLECWQTDGEYDEMARRNSLDKRYA